MDGNLVSSKESALDRMTCSEGNGVGTGNEFVPVGIARSTQSEPTLVDVAEGCERRIQVKRSASQRVGNGRGVNRSMLHRRNLGGYQIDCLDCSRAQNKRQYTAE